MTAKRKSPRSRSTKTNSGRLTNDRVLTSLDLRSTTSKKGKRRCHQVQKTNKGLWDNLPVHLLSCVIPHLSHLEDHMALSSLCKSWRKFIISEEKKPPLPPRSPVLMLVRKAGYEREIGKYHENLETKNLKSKLNIRICKVKLPGPAFRRCMGTNFGWVLAVNMDLQISLIHPFSGDHQIHFPSNPSLMELYNPDHHFLKAHLFDLPSDPKYTSLLIHKAALSSNPSSSECIVMGIFSRACILAFARPHDRYWTKFENLLISDDVIFYKGKFYSVDISGKLFVCDTNDAKPKARLLTPALRTKQNSKKYLVEFSGDLFLVVTNLHIILRGKWYDGVNRPQGPTYNSNELAVLKLVKITNDEGIESWNWERVFDLGNAAFLVGASTSVSLTTAGTSGFYKGNHIYITDEAVPRFNYFLTVINMESTTVESYCLNRLYASLPFSPFFYM